MRFDKVVTLMTDNKDIRLYAYAISTEGTFALAMDNCDPNIFPLPDCIGKIPEEGIEKAARKVDWEISCLSMRAAIKFWSQLGLVDLGLLLADKLNKSSEGTDYDN